MTPRFYANDFVNHWLPEAQVERPAVDCSTCSLADERPESRERWRKWKCCTFQPFVANFLAGSVREIDRALRESISWQPLGLIPHAGFRARYESTAEDQRGSSLICAFYDESTRSCRDWRNRPAECSTFFCKTENYPRESLSRQLSRLESSVAQMALAEFGFTSAEISEQIDFLNDPTRPEPVYEIDFVRDLYRRASLWARELTRDEVLSWK
jgi:Fe-S-cluster containining protein